MQGWTKIVVWVVAVVAPGGFLLLPLLLRREEVAKLMAKMPRCLTWRS